MSDSYFSIIPKTRNFPANKEKAASIVKWLCDQNIIQPEMSDCILSSSAGYAIAVGAKAVVKEPEYLPFDLTTNGLEVITEMTVFHQGEFTDEDDENLQLPETDLGFTFWNWPEPTDEFVKDFSEQLGVEVQVMIGRI